MRAVRRQMGVVLQHSQLMPGDIFTNIVGTSRLNIGDAWEAARCCSLEADIKAMPMGMHTVISEGGGTNCCNLPRQRNTARGYEYAARCGAQRYRAWVSGRRAFIIATPINRA